MLSQPPRRIVLLLAILGVSLLALWSRTGTSPGALRSLHYFDSRPPVPGSALAAPSPVTLAAGLPIELQLDLESAAHVVVVRVGAGGEIDWLRPISTDQQRSLEAGERILPEPAAPYRWVRDARGGEESYLVAVGERSPDFARLRQRVEMLRPDARREHRLQHVIRRLEEGMDSVRRVDFVTHP